MQGIRIVRAAATITLAAATIVIPLSQPASATGGIRSRIPQAVATNR